MASSLCSTSKVNKRTRPSTRSYHDHFGLKDLGVAKLRAGNAVTLCHKLCDLAVDELDTSCGTGLLVEPLHTLSGIGPTRVTVKCFGALQLLDLVHGQAGLRRDQFDVLGTLLGIVHAGLLHLKVLWCFACAKDKARLGVPSLTADFVVALLSPFLLRFGGERSVVWIRVIGSYDSGRVYTGTILGRELASAFFDDGDLGVGVLRSLGQSPGCTETEDARADDKDGRGSSRHCDRQMRSELQTRRRPGLASWLTLKDAIIGRAREWA
ncbi:hypothetical protein HG531_005444 [Fusarium graminearum]|nr:hypothetical protein HG531_005444 [Fusarium graminearum]